MKSVTHVSFYYVVIINKYSNCNISSTGKLHGHL